jgi:ferredoxin
MKLSIDLDRCQGHGRCYSTEPDIFEPIDDIGHAGLIEGELPAQSPSLIRRLELVVAGCPERAISFDAEENSK